MALGRAILFARDMQKMTAFYRDVLELTPLPDEHPSEAWQRFDAGGCELALHAVPAEHAARIEIAEPPEPRAGTPLKLVFTVADVAAARERLRAHGVPLLDGGGAPERADALDPEGNVFQIAAAWPA